MTVATTGVKLALVMLAAMAALNLFAEGEPKMPTLNWMGREKATKSVKEVVMKILREDKSLSYGSGDNVLVHGDNLEALKALLPFYAGQVKCIYIDPPYNTGSAFEHYDDNLEHSTWLNMMYPRLKLLHDFMREDASIWISIDDREGAYLRVICDEIFGRQNFVGNVAWQRTYSKRGDSQGIPVEVEHVLVYSKREGWQPKKLARTEEMDALYKNPDNDPAGRWQNTSAFAPSGRSHQGMVYAIQHPFTGEMLYPTKDACWRYDQNSMLEIMNGWAEYELREIDDTEKRAAICGVGVEEVRKGVKAIVLSKSLEESKKSASIVMKRGQWPRFYFTSGGKGGIRRKTYLSAVGGVPASNLWLHKDVGHTDEAKKEVLKVFDGQSPFATPKPERLIKRVLEIATDEGDLVLDSFLGSGTTTAVAHKMGRRWIGIEMGEHAKTHCAVRMKKVVDGEQGGISKAVKWQGGGGFRYYELGEAILNEDGSLTCDIPFDVMAAHVWFSETKTPYMGGKKSTVLGVHEGTAYALLYNGILRDRSVNGGNVLTRKTLEVIQADLAGRDYEKIVIYGEACRLMAPTLESLKIEFRQTPYDLVTRR
jgi:adenine-specific DNA-methyltransferase